jgi:uncharacterized membrane protein
MPRIETVKEQLNWLKLAFGILVATNFSLVGWLAQNYESSDIKIVTLALVSIFIASFGIIYVVKKAKNKMNELEEL